MKYYLHDNRPLSEKEENINALNLLQEILEDSIADYAVENAENLYDEEYQEILRKLEFSQGNRSYFIVIAPDGFLRTVAPKIPRALLLNIHNALL